MKRLFLVNPKAGGGRALERWRSVRPRFAAEIQSGGSCEWIPASREELFERLPEFLGGGPAAAFHEWVVLGGDGTLNAVVTGLLRATDLAETGAGTGAGTGADTAARVLPALRVDGAGSGSDYFRSLPDGAPVPVDAVRVTIDDREVRYCLNMASAGLSARVAAAKEQLPSWVPRALVYALPTVSEIWGARPFQAELRLPGRDPLSGRIWGVFLSKGRFAGGGMRFGAEVRLDDGELEISWVEEQSPWAILRRLPGLYGSGLTSQPGVLKFRSAAAELRFDEPQGIELDGEAGRGSRMLFELLPASKSGLKFSRFS